MKIIKRLIKTEQYDERLMERTQLIVANKMDMPGAEEQLEQFKEHFDGSQKIFRSRL